MARDHASLELDVVALEQQKFDLQCEVLDLIQQLDKMKNTVYALLEMHRRESCDA